MTREEAIENLKILKEDYWDDDGYGHETKQYEDTMLALDMAIKALEQETTTKNDLVVDCISRIETIDYLCKHCPDDGECFKDCDEIKHLRQMPPVTPQEPRKGHWTEEFNDLEGEVRFTCSSCGKYQLFGTDFCYHCGSDNREVVEK